MASGGEISGGVRGQGYGHRVAEAEIEVKTEECSEGCDCRGEGEVLLSEFLKNKSFRGEAGERWKASEGEKDQCGQVGHNWRLCSREG